MTKQLIITNIKNIPTEAGTDFKCSFHMCNIELFWVYSITTK